MWSQARNTYSNSRRRLVIAFDVGTTCSGISYSILDPGQVPKVEGVTQFPSSADGKPVSVSKVPSVLYYDAGGSLQAVGAETFSESIKEKAYDEKWVRVEWFKLHLKPKQDEKDDADAIPPLPLNKTFEDVLTDYLTYLNDCALRFIEHAHGAAMWDSLLPSLRPSPNNEGRYPAGQGIVYILSHPNGWEGYQQQCYATAACKAGLVPDDTDSLSERLHFITEGEASLHWASETFGSSNVMKEGTGFTIVDAGGGTIDVSSYRRKKKESEKDGIFEEIAPPSCHFQGSVFVTVRARTFLKQRLIDSEYYDDLDDILEAFDDTTKLRFRDPQDPQFVKFAGVGDNDRSVGIRFGQLRLNGDDVAALFQPAIDCIHKAVIEQRKLSNTKIAHIILVGGFVNNDYLFNRVKSVLSSFWIKVQRLENLPNKAVANGAVSYYLGHFVRARLSKVGYGFFAPRDYDYKQKAHRKQLMKPNGYFHHELGTLVLRNYFYELLAKNEEVSEFRETRHHFYQTSLDAFQPNERDIMIPIWCYNGKIKGEKFWDDVRERGNYKKAFTFVANADHVPQRLVTGQLGVMFWRFDADIVLYFGLPSIRADLAWVEDGVEKRRPAKLVYDAPWLTDRLMDEWDCHPGTCGSIAAITNNERTIENLD